MNVLLATFLVLQFTWLYDDYTVQINLNLICICLKWLIKYIQNKKPDISYQREY